MTSNELSKSFYDFESENIEQLSEIQFQGFIVWSAIKKDLYYDILQFFTKTQINAVAGNSPKSLKRSIIYWKRLLLRPTKTVFYTNDINRNYKNAQGKFPETILQPIIENHGRENFIAIEENMDYHKVSVHKSQLVSAGATNYVIRLIRIALRVFGFGKSTSKAIESLLSLKPNYPKCDGKTIRNAYLKFAADYVFWKFFFRLKKVERIFMSDEMGSGKMAAAKRLNISCFEFQHGIVVRHKVDYYVSENVLPYKSNYVTPTKIVLFGNFWKNLILKSGFWKDNELKVLGSYRVSQYQDKSIDRIHGTCLVLSQWLFVDEICKILEEINRCDSKFQFYIKPHPADSESSLIKFKNLTRSSNRMELLEKEANTHEWMQKSEFVLSCSSFALLEGVGLGAKAISFTTTQYPRGIHDVIEVELENLVPLVSSGVEVIETMKTTNTSPSESPEFYNSEYSKNLKDWNFEIA